MLAHAEWTHSKHLESHLVYSLFKKKPMECISRSVITAKSTISTWESVCDFHKNFQEHSLGDMRTKCKSYFVIYLKYFFEHKLWHSKDFYHWCRQSAWEFFAPIFFLSYWDVTNQFKCRNRTFSFDNIFCPVENEQVHVAFNLYLGCFFIYFVHIVISFSLFILLIEAQ